MSEHGKSQEPLGALAEVESRIATLEECQKHFAFAQKLWSAPSPYSRDTMSRLVSYWDHRVRFEQAKQRTGPHAFNPHAFAHYGTEGRDLALSDARRRLKLYSVYSSQASQRPDLRPENYALTKEMLSSDQRAVDQHKENYRKERSQSHYAEKAQEARKYLRKQEGLESYPQIIKLIEAGTLEPVSLLETPIRKANIMPAIVAVIGGIAYRSYLAAYEEYEQDDLNVQMSFPQKSIESAVGRLTRKYYGNVPAVIGTKLPVTEEFLTSYFSRQDPGSILPESIVRLQFDATLKPTGKPAFVARVGTVLYEGVNDDGNHRIVTTVRKVDRIAAELAVQSFVDESKTVRRIIDSNSYEVLAGLPSLGKRR